MFKKFQPTLDSLEDRTVPSAAPTSPLTDVAVTYAAAAVKNFASLEAYVSTTRQAATYYACYSSAVIEAFAAAETRLDNTIKLMEQYESYYKAMGYNDAYFKYYDTVFHNYDNAVWSYLTELEPYTCSDM